METQESSREQLPVVVTDPNVGEDLPFVLTVRKQGVEEVESWTKLDGTTKAPPDTTRWGFKTVVETTVQGIERVVSQIVFAYGNEQDRVMLSTSWSRLVDYEVKVDPILKVRLAPWLDLNPAWKREWLKRKAAVKSEIDSKGLAKSSPGLNSLLRIGAQLAEGVLGIKTCGTCQAFDRKTGKEELTKATHTFQGTIQDAPGTQGMTMTQAMISDIAQTLSQQVGTRSLDPEKTGLCNKRASLLEEDLLACPLYEG